MSERERIESMVREGRLTREEADRLLIVLDDMDGMAEEVEQVEREAQSDPGFGAHGGSGAGSGTGNTGGVGDAPGGTSGEGRSAGASGPYGGRGAPGVQGPRGLEAPARPAGAGAPPTPPVPPTNFREDTSGTAPREPEGLQWLEVQLLAGDLKIRVDEKATSPSANSRGAGEFELEKTERGYRFNGTASGGEGSILDRLLGSITRGDTTITVPKGYGLKLDMKAGDVEISGPLAYLSGNMLAGDIDVPEVHGINLRMSAGDLDVGLLLTEGEHRISSMAGDLNVRLLGPSDVKVHGYVRIGDVSLPSDWRKMARGLGSSFEHQLGGATAELAVELGTGDLDIETANG